MPKKDTQQPAKPESSSTPAKRPGVRKLQTLEDLRRLQGKLLRAFLSGEMNRDDFKTAMYGTTCLCQVMRELRPANSMADVVTSVTIGLGDQETAAFIAQMNASIMAAPEENSDA